MYEVINNSIITMGLTKDEIIYLRNMNFLTGMTVEDALETLYNNINSRKDMFYDVVIGTVIANEGRSKLMIQRPRKNKGGRPKKN